jgi:hypothetical protein
MERKTNRPVNAQKHRRRNTILWILAVVAVVIGLLAKEQIALLYVLATLSVAALLIVVAWSDLGGARAVATGEPAPFDDAAAIADGQTAQTATLNSVRTKARRG